MRGFVLTLIAILIAVVASVDPYKILNVADVATEKEVSDAHRRLLKKYKKNEHMREVVDEAYHEIIAERSIQVVEDEVAASQAAQVRTAPRGYAGGHHRRRGFRRGLRAPLANLARAVMAAGDEQPAPAPAAAVRPAKDLTETQVQNISTAKGIIWLFELLLKIVFFGLLCWCLLPQLKMRAQRPHELRRDM